MTQTTSSWRDQSSPRAVPPRPTSIGTAGRLQSEQVADISPESVADFVGMRTMTHDYKRNGTTTLFAALNVLDGTVVGRCMPRHTHQEFVKFLNAVERAVPPGKLVHAIADNYATHKHPKVIEWLADHQRWIFHFTPTSASWINAVEGFFSVITRRRIRRGVFTSVADLQDAIRRYIREHNQDPKPFVWTKPADVILTKISRLPVASV